MLMPKPTAWCVSIVLAALAGPAVAALPHWQFEARLEAGSDRLRVEACSAEPIARVEFAAAARADGALVEARRSHGQRLNHEGSRLVGMNWQAGECLRTEVDLPAAAKLDRFGLGGRTGHYWRLPPRHWLWRPAEIDPDSVIRFNLPTGWAASVPWRPLGEGRYRLGSTPADWPATTVIGRFAEHPIRRAGGTLRVSVVPVADALPETALIAWVEEVADHLLQSHGRLPLPDAQVLVLPLPGATSPVPWGQVTRGGGTAVLLFPGLQAGAPAWSADWTATHEFAHLLHPFMGDRGRWLGEGLASYYQNVLRARSGHLRPDEAWRKLSEGFARGRSATPAGAPPLAEVSATRARGSTMRVYWSGAAFWLDRDLALRQQGMSLDQVLARFAREHLPAERRWAPEAFMAALQDLAPEGQWIERYTHFARSRTFPSVPEAVARAAAGRPLTGAFAGIMTGEGEAGRGAARTATP